MRKPSSPDKHTKVLLTRIAKDGECVCGSLPASPNATRARNARAVSILLRYLPKPTSIEVGCRHLYSQHPRLNRQSRVGSDLPPRRAEYSNLPFRCTRTVVESRRSQKNNRSECPPRNTPRIKHCFGLELQSIGHTSASRS